MRCGRQRRYPRCNITPSRLRPDMILSLLKHMYRGESIGRGSIDSMQDYKCLLFTMVGLQALPSRLQNFQSAAVTEKRDIFEAFTTCFR